MQELKNGYIHGQDQNGCVAANAKKKEDSLLKIFYLIKYGTSRVMLTNKTAQKYFLEEKCIVIQDTY